MRRSVDDNLRRVNLALAAHIGIGLLPRGEARIRQGIFPAQIIPVINRQAERDDRWILGQLTDDLVRRRAGRASFRGEKFHHRAPRALARAEYSPTTAERNAR